MVFYTSLRRATRFPGQVQPVFCIAVQDQKQNKTLSLARRKSQQFKQRNLVLTYAFLEHSLAPAQSLFFSVDCLLVLALSRVYFASTYTKHHKATLLLF